MTNLSVFQFESHSVRVIEVNGEPWFVAKDICQVLNIKNVGQALTRLDEDEKSTIILNDGTPGNPDSSIISESGMYALVLSSRKPDAKPFRKWVTAEVLPTIRRTGSYTLASTPELPQQPSPHAVAYIEAAKTLETLQNPILKSLLEQRLMEELTPTNKLLSGEVTGHPTHVILTVRAKELGVPSARIGNGAALGRFIIRQGIEPIGKVQHGKYPVNAFELTPELDNAIRAYFS